MSVEAAEAEQEFERFVEAMGLDADPADMSEEDRKGFDEQKRRVIRAMQKGILVIDEAGQPVFTPQVGNTEPLTFHEPTGASVIAMDSKRQGRDVAKMYATLADMTRTNEKRFSQMAIRDLKVCMALSTLFFG